ncbi:MAG TPA: hypothetical protein VFU79_01205 [Nitrososphaeraceae archaeon]|nr:hypothetical protein [Nitrososphaeraceae archaeon]
MYPPFESAPTTIKMKKTKINQSIEDFKSESRTYAYKQPSQIVTSRFKMRDLYNREKRLGYWIERIKIKANAKDVLFIL